MTPKIFIGMPVYNGERYIEKALNSLIYQSFTDWKLLISDDASTDGTRKICERFAAMDKRISYVRQEKNLSLFPNFKFTMDAADAEYFMWAAQDDMWDKDFMSVCVEHLEKDAELGMATTSMVEIDSYSRVVRELPWLKHFSGKPSLADIARYILEPEILGKCNLMYGLFRTDVLRKVWQVYPQRAIWGQDYMFVLALISRFKVVVDERMLFKKRYGGFSSPTSNDNDSPTEALQRNYANPKDHTFPFVKFRGYFSGHAEALKGTNYRAIGIIILLTRLPRAYMNYLKERNFKKKLKKTLESMIGERTYMKLWKATVDAYRNKKRGKKIQRKNEASILEFKNRFNPRVFIETGTYRGDMVNTMKNRFEKLYSIELGTDLYEAAKTRFASDKRIEIIHGDSGIELAKLMERIDEPALFWLDAHYSGGVTARGLFDTPIERELQILMNHRVKEHVILIDDARHFIGANNYPTADVIERIARDHGRSFEMKDDNFRIYPKSK